MKVFCKPDLRLLRRVSEYLRGRLVIDVRGIGTLRGRASVAAGSAVCYAAPMEGSCQLQRVALLRNGA
jgi:hypothetical protein